MHKFWFQFFVTIVFTSVFFLFLHLKYEVNFSMKNFLILSRVVVLKGEKKEGISSPTIMETMTKFL